MPEGDRSGGGDVAPPTGSAPSRRRMELLADRDLVSLVLDRRSEAAWAVLREALAAYALDVLGAWLRSGVARERAGAVRGLRGLSKLPQFLQLDEHSAEALATEVVAQAIGSFRHSSLPKWKPDEAGGASLRTYFVNWALFQLPDAYARWERREGRPESQASLDDIAVEPKDLAGGPEDLVCLWDCLSKVVEGADDLLMVQMRLLGYQLDDISAALADRGVLKTQREVSLRVRELVNRALQLRSRRNDD